MLVGREGTRMFPLLVLEESAEKGKFCLMNVDVS